MLDTDLKEYCFNLYNNLFREYYDAINTNATSEQKRVVAQKQAIKNASILALKQFPNIDPPEIWNTIYAAHVNKFSGISDFSIIDKIIKADNSWKKSSGHAFEEMIKELGNLSLLGHSIEFMLQRDLGRLIRNNELLNEVRDISWLKEQIKTSIFDLYLVKKDDVGYYVFGCVQSKTSIRDRVTRDREPSINAMKAFFMSIAIVLNGDFLRLPKFTHMVNGNSPEYEINGWHSMYVFSNKHINNNRIKSIDINMETLVEDIVKGADFWFKQRQWFDHKWLP